MISLYCVAMLHPNIVHLDLWFHWTTGWVQWVSIWKRQECDDGKNMKEWWSHCIVSQCFTQILCTLSSNLIVRQVECSECLYERDRNEMMVKTWRSNDLTVLCRNASPKYCAPWSPIRLKLRLSAVCVYMKETEIRWW